MGPVEPTCDRPPPQTNPSFVIHRTVDHAVTEIVAQLASLGLEGSGASIDAIDPMEQPSVFDNDQSRDLFTP